MTSMASSDTVQRLPGSFSDEKHDSTHLVQSSDGKMENTVKQKKKKQPTVPLHKLFRFKTKGDTAMIVVASFCSVIVGFLQPVAIGFFGAFMKKVFDAFENGENAIDATRPIVLVFVYIGTIILVCAYVGNCFWVLSGQRQINRIRRLYVHAIMRQDMAWFDMAEDGSLTTRLAADAQCIQDGISERFGQMIKTLAAFIIGFLLAFAVCWRLAVIILAVLPFLAAAGGLMGYFVTKATLNVQTSYAEAGSIAEQVFSGIRTVFAFTLQNRFADIYDEKLVEARKRGERRAIYYGIGFGGFLFVLFCIFGIGFWYGGQLIIHQGVSGVWVLVAFFAMLLGAMSLLQLPAHLSAIAAACGAAHKIYATIDRVPDIDIDSPLGEAPEKVLGDIEFRRVQFAYPTRPDLTVLKDFSINIKSGMTVAFVGPSGSGKSTSVQLIQRFYDPLAGSVFLDGKDIKNLNLNWLRRQIGVVSQEPVLFNLTIKQNLLMGTHDPNVSHEAVVEACKSANCHDFIMQLPDKYDTIVGEHGGMLSGGQKQRIAIARAILKNPSILLLDEATSALDTQSERLVQKALDSASTNRTTIVIAHRLSTIRNADLIVVMKQGEIVEQGTHNQLLDVDGVYAELVRKQQIDTENEDELDEDELMKREMVALQQQSDPSRVSKIQMDDKDETAGEPLARCSTKSSIDVYELKLIKEKAERKSKKSQKAPIRKVLQQMRSEWHLLVLGSIGALVAGAIFPALGYVVARGVSSLAASDAASVAPSPMEGTNLDGFLFLMFGIIALLSHAVQFIAHDTAGERYIERLRSLVFRAFLKQEIGYFDQEENSVGAMTTRLALDSKNVNEMITKVLGDVMQMVGCLITGLVIAFYYDWATTLITLLFAPFLLGASLYESQIQRNFEDKVSKANQHSSEIAGEAFKEIRTVAGLGKQNYFENKFERATVRPHKLAKRKAYLASIGYALLQGTIMYAGAVAFYAGMNFIQQGRIETMDMIIVLIEVLITVDGVGRCSIFTSTFVKGKVSAITTFELLERQSAIDPDLEGIEPQTADGHFSFDDIAFRYPARPDMPVFDGDFHLEGQAGQTVALVGPSGCGKSTVIGMLQRWYDPISGTVRLDENNVKNYTLGNLRSHMALVGQEPVLFDTTIEQNIRFGAPEGMAVTQADVEAAARAANIHAFVSDLPEGYQTRVGDKGSQLSGGQKQRIAIARALIRQPRVLLLDEATSALDSESEKIVQAAIDTIIKEGNRTTITIAHRLSTIQDADLICVIKAGQVVEKGTHQELLRLNGVYAELVRQQTLTAI